MDIEMATNQLGKGIKDAINAHATWRLKLKAAIMTGHSEFTVQNVSCNDKCAFGKWLQGTDFDEEARMGAPYRVISRLHTEFHKCAGDVLALATTERGAEAMTLLDGDFRQQSEKLIRGLRKWELEAR